MTVPQIRAAEESDAPAIAGIYAPYVRSTAVSFEVDPPAESLMARRVASTLDTYPWLVAEVAGQVVGYAYAAEHRERPAYRWTVDTSIYVDAAAHHRGIGRTLYAVLLCVLEQQGFRSAFAEIVLPNPASARLHESLGFRALGVHENIGFKLGAWRDIGYWQLGLAEPTLFPNEPIPFTWFRKTPAFAKVLDPKE
jgi:L-amino acid N-acyltransferase YncA